jgi:diaminopropionate ammonia-lyase
MSSMLANPWRSTGLRGPADADLSVDAGLVQELLLHCPAAGVTALLDPPDMAADLGVEHLWIKDERDRMGLGSFKALGAAYVIAREADARFEGNWDRTPEAVSGALADVTYVSASAGNHGLSVAAGARVFGANAVIVLSQAVPEGFAQRLERFGARVVRAGFDYEESMTASQEMAKEEGWTLLSDSSWPGYTEIPRQVMEGYLVMGVEAAEQVEAIAYPPTHLFLQAGVGGLAASMAALARHLWGDNPLIVVVEPDRAPCLTESIRAGRAVRADGPVSNMGRLDAKEPSHLALIALARDADFFVTVSDEEAVDTVRFLDEHGIATTPSGAAGVAGLQHAGRDRQEMLLDGSSRVLTFVSEGPEPA